MALATGREGEGSMTATLDGVFPELRRRIEWIQRATDVDPRRKGSRFWVTTGYRGMDEQLRKYREMQDAQRRYGARWQQHAALAAFPGTSEHGQDYETNAHAARAVDLACDPVDEPLRAEYAQRASLIRPIVSEHWHMQLAPVLHPLPDEPNPAPMEDPDDMLPRFALNTRKGGAARWVLVPDTQELRALGGAEFYGNVRDLPAKDRPDSVYDITELPDRDGYLIAGFKDGHPDWFGAFDAAEWSALQAAKAHA